MFIDRESELAALNRLWASDKPEFFIVYGRRRVGKTELLKQFCRDKSHIYFLAAQVRDEDNLRQFKEAVKVAIDDPMLDAMEFANWETALLYIAKEARDRRLIVVFDEFQYLCEGNPSLPSIFQRFWDTQGLKTRLFIVLCGSYVGFMEKEVLSERSPLFGRRTGQAKLQPLRYFNAVNFFPDYSLQDRLVAYGILGGVPAYLSRFSPQRSLRENVISELLSVQGYLYDEVNFLLRMELSNVATYSSLLKAVASGATKLNEIASRAGIDSPSASKYLNVLRGLGFIERRVPAFERAPERSRKGLYFVADNYMRFWFRFVLPHLSLIQIGQGEAVYDRFILPFISGYMGDIFEDICRDFVVHKGHSLFGEYTRMAGKHWDRDFDIDIVALLVDGTYVFAECKWWQGPVGMNVLNDLKEKVGRLPQGAQDRSKLALFALNGFTEEVRAAAAREGVCLVAGEALF
ncbi:MAG TPA: ATP-binding protein [Firmicutes bacterium]|nr:ATP-binding protein [Bacillota bacterium]